MIAIFLLFSRQNEVPHQIVLRCMKKIYSLLIASLLILVSCEKDDKGMYLSPNYCTAIVNGEEYAYQERKAIPMMWGNWPDADYQTHYSPSFGIKLPLLEICTDLLPLSDKTDSRYFIRLYIRDFKIDDPWAGQTYHFTHVEHPDVEKLYEAMSQENVNIALVECLNKGEKLTVTASGNIRFGNHEAKWCAHEANKCFEADFNLKIEGADPIEINGHLFTRLEY